MDLKNYKKELTLEVMNERGQVVKRFFLHRCWISEYTTAPDLDANANAIAIESIKFELEGWERDLDTKEPDETAAVPASA
jgi:phage tail-like protein